MDALPTLSIGIMAHPARREWVGELQAILGPVPVSYDLSPGDPGRQGMLANGAAAWRLHDPAAAYHLVLQDDVALCADFVAQARAFLTRFTAPGTEPSAVSFYYSGTRIHRAGAHEGAERGWHWAKLRWGPAICLPVAWIPAMLEDYESQQMPHYDTRIGSWLRGTGRGAYHPLPCLVDHRGEDSLIGNRPGRKAAQFLGDL